MIPGHALEKNTRNLCRFFSFLFQDKIRQHIRPHDRLDGRLCRTRRFCVQRLCGPQYYLSSFQLFQQKRWSCGRFNCISTLACKGPVCVAVLTSFYGRSFVEVGEFIDSKSFHLDRHFFHLLTAPYFGALNRESESSGSQRVYRKLFPRGPHSSENNFFEIKISRPTSLDFLSVLSWLLVTYHTITSLSRVWPVNTFHQNNRKSHFNAIKYIGCDRIGYLFRIYFTFIQSIEQAKRQRLSLNLFRHYCKIRSQAFYPNMEERSLASSNEFCWNHRMNIA